MTVTTKVALLEQHSYDSDLLAESVDRLFSVNGIDRSYSSSVILLKPNLISALNSRLACTEPAVILAAAKWFLDRSAQVKVGDSPAFGSSHSVLKSLGILAELRKLGVDIVEFNKYERVRLKNNIYVHMATEARECDMLVNLPRVKAHIQLRLTMAVKNLFGCVSGVKKAWYHMLYGGPNGIFSDVIVQLPSVLPPTISLADGIKVMHKKGPIDGEPILLGFLGCSLNPIALDTALLDILSVTPQTCPLYVAAEKIKLPGYNLADIHWTIKKSNEFDFSEFLVPHELIPVRFSPSRFFKSSIRRFIQRFSPK